MLYINLQILNYKSLDYVESIWDFFCGKDFLIWDSVNGKADTYFLLKRLKGKVCLAFLFDIPSMTFFRPGASGRWTSLDVLFSVLPDFFVGMHFFDMLDWCNL